VATTTPEVDIDYDREADVLYISLGPPRPAAGLEPEEGLVLRLDPESDELVGVTIVGARARLQRQPDWRPAPFDNQPAIWERAKRAAAA
jgi:uncharacterized protein YuzE